MDEDDHALGVVDGDGSYACTAGDLKKGDYAMLSKKPCKVRYLG